MFPWEKDCGGKAHLHECRTLAFRMFFPIFLGGFNYFSYLWGIFYEL